MKNCDSNNKYFFTFAFFVRKHIWKNLVYFVTFLLQINYWKSSNKTPTSIQICIGLVDTVLGSKILGNRLGILMQILTAMNCYFFFKYFKELLSI